MKRSEMIELLAYAIEYHEWKGEADELADRILTFLEKQGMQPPLAEFMVNWDRWDPDRKEWYPTKERIHSHKWEPEEELT